MCVCPEHQRWLVIEGGHKMTITAVVKSSITKLSQPALMSMKSHRYAFTRKQCNICIKHLPFVNEKYHNLLAGVLKIQLS